MTTTFRMTQGSSELRVTAHPGKSPRGLRYLRLYLEGTFWGFEENENGHIWEYLLEKSKHYEWIIADLGGLTLYTDNGPVLIRALTKNLNRKGGDAAICNAVHPHVKQVLNIAGFEHFATGAEAIAHFEAQL